MSCSQRKSGFVCLLLSYERVVVLEQHFTLLGSILLDCIELTIVPVTVYCGFCCSTYLLGSMYKYEDKCFFPPLNLDVGFNGRTFRINFFIQSAILFVTEIRCSALTQNVFSIYRFMQFQGQGSS